jgi:hypothetical protein
MIFRPPLLKAFLAKERHADPLAGLLNVLQWAEGRGCWAKTCSDVSNMVHVITAAIAKFRIIPPVVIVTFGEAIKLIPH